MQAAFHRSKAGLHAFFFSLSCLHKPPKRLSMVLILLKDVASCFPASHQPNAKVLRCSVTVPSCFLRRVQYLLAHQSFGRNYWRVPRTIELQL